MGPCLQRDRVCLVRCPRDRDAARPGDRTARRGSQIAIDRGRAGIGHGGGTQHREALRRSQERSRQGRRGTTQPRRKRDDEGQASTRPSRTFRDTHLRRPFLEWMTLGWLPSPTSHPGPTAARDTARARPVRCRHPARNLRTPGLRPSPREPRNLLSTGQSNAPPGAAVGSSVRHGRRPALGSDG